MECRMLYIILGIIMVFMAWMQAAMGKLQKYKKDAREQWVRVDALLQTRSRYILDLLELADQSGLEAGDLLAEIYELGGGYCQSDDREVISEQAENVTPLLDRLLTLAREYPALGNEEVFQELSDNLTELEEEIEIQSSRYNHFIDLYNEHRERPGIRLQMAILGAIPLKGIHLRQKKLQAEKE
jgi:hypothetical protein